MKTAIEYLKKGVLLVVSLFVLVALVFLTGLLAKVIWKLFLSGWELW
jgi:hypothetical protein